MTHVTLPPALSVAKALGGILGKDVKATAQKAPTPLPLKECFVGRYDDGAGTLEALVVIDFALAASLGSALALIPAGVTKDAIKVKKLEGDMRDNAYEVANILANSFVGKRVRLIDFAEPKAASEEALRFAAAAGQTLRLEIAIPSYPGGILELYGPVVPAGA